MTSCFGNRLDPDYQKYINQFRREYESLQEFALSRRRKLSVTWKVHLVTAHLGQFLDNVKVGLARYVEQTSEAAHAEIKPVEKRFRVAESNPRHAKQLRSTAVVFSSPRIYILN